MFPMMIPAAGTDAAAKILTTPANLIIGSATGPAVCASIMPIISSTPGVPTAITTVAPHGLVSSEPVAIGGMLPGTVAAPAGVSLNGPYHPLLTNPIVVTGATTFDIPYFTTVVSTGGAVGCNLIEDAGGFPTGIDFRGITLIAGPAAGEINVVIVNLGTTLILGSPWSPANPGAGSVYLIPVPDQEPDDLAMYEIPRPAFTIASGLTGVDAGPGLSNGTAVAYLDFKVTVEVVPGICSVFVGGTGIGQDGALPDYTTSSLVANGMPNEGSNDGTLNALGNPFVWPTRLDENLEVKALNAAGAKLIGRGTIVIPSLQAAANTLIFEEAGKYTQLSIFGDPTTVGTQTCPPLIVDLSLAGEVLDGDTNFDGSMDLTSPPYPIAGTGDVITVRQCDTTGTIASPHDIDAIFENNDTLELVLRSDTAPAAGVDGQRELSQGVRCTQVTGNVHQDIARNHRGVIVKLVDLGSHRDGLTVHHNTRDLEKGIGEYAERTVFQGPTLVRVIVEMFLMRHARSSSLQS